MRVRVPLSALRKGAQVSENQAVMLFSSNRTSAHPSAPICAISRFESLTLFLLLLLWKHSREMALLIPSVELLRRFGNLTVP